MGAAFCYQWWEVLKIKGMRRKDWGGGNGFDVRVNDWYGKRNPG